MLFELTYITQAIMQHERRTAFELIVLPGRMNEVIGIDNYKQEKEWNSVLFKDEMSEKKLQEMLKEVPLNKEEELIYYNNPKVSSSLFNNTSFDISHITGIISVCYLHVEFKNLNSHPLDAILKSNIQLWNGCNILMNINMIINLIFAKILKIDIVELKSQLI
jgi:hypothetical protein